MKKSQVAKDVRVKLNSNWIEKCLGDKYLAEEPVLYLRDGVIYNDERGDHVYIFGGGGTTSGYAYLDMLDLEFPIGEKPLYDWGNPPKTKDKKKDLEDLLAEFKQVHKYYNLSDKEQILENFTEIVNDLKKVL